MKQANPYKGKLEWQSEFSHRYACWAKMKKSNKKLAKRRLKQELRKELQNEENN